jgi:hypothetical protein
MLVVAAVRPARRTRLPVKKTRIIPRWFKLQVLAYPEKRAGKNLFTTKARKNENTKKKH